MERLVPMYSPEELRVGVLVKSETEALVTYRAEEVVLRHPLLPQAVASFLYGLGVDPDATIDYQDKFGRCWRTDARPVMGPAAQLTPGERRQFVTEATS